MIDNNTMTARIVEPKPAVPYVGDDGIFVPSDFDHRCHKLLISKELFVEAYHKWIMNEDGSAGYAQWLINPDGYYPYCSNCEEEPKSGYMTPYCPNCGRKMINIKRKEDK